MKSWLGSKSADDKQNEAEEKRRKQQEAAAKKKQRQEEQRKKKEDAKAGAKRKQEHKRNESRARKQLATERKKGVKGRKDVMAQFDAEAIEQKAAASAQAQERDRKQVGGPPAPQGAPPSGPSELKKGNDNSFIARYKQVDDDYQRRKHDLFDARVTPLIADDIERIKGENAHLTAEEAKAKAIREMPEEKRREIVDITTHIAYSETWLKLDESKPLEAQVRAHRPPQETAAERMQAELGHFQAEYMAANRAQLESRKALKGGRTASAKIEALYDEQERLIADWTSSKEGKPPEKTEVQALKDARERVWGRYAKPFEHTVPDTVVDGKKRGEAINEERERFEEIVRKREGIDFGGAMDFRLRMDARRRIAADKVKLKRGRKKNDQHAVNLTQMVVDPIAGTAGGVSKVATMGTGMAAKIPSMASNATEKLGGSDWMPDVADIDTKAAGKFLGDFDGLFSSVTHVLGNMSDMSRLFTDEDATISKNPELWATTVDSAVSALNGSIAVMKGAAEIVVVSFNAAEHVVSYAVPGFDIVGGVLNLTTAAVQLGTTGARLGKVNTSLAKARSRPHELNQLDVLVNPFLKLQSKYGKQVEIHSFAVAKALVDIAASIANVATAGGYGAPKAVQGAAALVNMIHSLSHTIANQILTAQAQVARKNANVKHLEGGAEEVQRKDVSTAIDVILLRAQKDKDPVAISYLKSFGIPEEKIAKKDPLENYKMHRRVMKDMKEDEDPKWLWPKLVETVGKIGEVGGELGHIGKQVDALYGARGHDKSWAAKSYWYSKMYLEALVNHDRFVRSKRKTEIAQGHKLLEERVPVPGAKESKGRIAIAKLGDVILYSRAAEVVGADGKVGRDTAGLAAEEEAFLTATEKATVEDLKVAANAAYHSADWKDYFHRLLVMKLREEKVSA